MADAPEEPPLPEAAGKKKRPSLTSTKSTKSKKSVGSKKSIGSKKSVGETSGTKVSKKPSKEKSKKSVEGAKSDEGAKSKEKVKDDAAVKETTAEEGGDERQQWGSKTAYILTLVGYAIGFGNVWRFPYLLQKNGGVAFFIPYTLMLCIAGIPVFYIEVAIGQRMRRGAIGSWNTVSPYLAGIGIAGGLCCIIVGLFYNTLLAWVISYFIWSWDFSGLGWAKCQNKSEASDYSNITGPSEECLLAGPASYFWFRETLDVSEDINDPGSYNGYIAMWIVIAWIIVWGCLIKGTKSTGKVVYFTATFPYAILLIFLIRGFFLEDFAEGFKELYSPKWEKLLQGKVWLDAGTQIFFSLGLAFGSIVAFASYLPPNNNCYIDAICVPIVNCLTSVFASLVIFITLGEKGVKEYKSCRGDRIYIAKTLTDPFIPNGFEDYNFTVPDVGLISKFHYWIKNSTGNEILGPFHWDSKLNNTDQYSDTFVMYAPDCDKSEKIQNTGVGTGLVFITFAEAINTFPIPNFFALLFFLMLITLGIDSAFGPVEGLLACIDDLKFCKVKHWITTTILCVIYMIFALMVYPFGFGIYVLTFIDEVMIGGWPLIVIALLECIAVAWVYGLKQFCYDIKLMTGHRPNAYLMLCWKFITPCFLIIVLLAFVGLQFSQYPKYPAWNREAAQVHYIEWPGYLLGIGLTICFTISLSIPIVAILYKFGYKVIREPPAVFPEESLKKERNYDADKDVQSSSSLQRGLMAQNITDLKSVKSNPEGTLLPENARPTTEENA